MEMLIQNNVSGSGGGVKNKTLIKNTIVAAEPTIPLTDKPGFKELAAGITQLNQLRLSQINNLNATIANLTKERDTLQSQVTSLNTSVSSLTTQRNNLQTQVNSLNQNLRDERVCAWAVTRDLTGYLISSPDTYAITKERLTAGLKGLTCYSKKSHVYNNGSRYSGTTIISPNKSFYPVAALVTIRSKTDSSIREQCAACRVPTGTWYCTSGLYYRISVDSSGDIFCNATSTDYRYMSFETEEYLIGMPA